MKGLILEGMAGSGKSRLLAALKTTLAEEHDGTLMLISEALTERTLEPLADATADDARHLIHDILGKHQDSLFRRSL